MAIMKWNPSRELLNVEREMNKFFNSFGSRFGLMDTANNDEYENAVWAPLTDISEDKDNYIIKLDLPGVSKEDVKISYLDGQLSISGERKQEKETKELKFHRVERTYGRYVRSFTLPGVIKEDKIDAEFKNGQLQITVPKAEEAKPKEISIKIN
ncbi:MAG: Hsp20/alpha crystallin family protein [Ignavibacteriaceae bacterium]|nr:Hsp20/alpha crystallin family protein [Ignavibacteriaceae bacterium]